MMQRRIVAPLGWKALGDRGFTGDNRLARISHRWSTTSPQSSALAVFRSVGLLDVLHEYDCGGSPRVVSVASLARTALAATQ